MHEIGIVGPGAAGTTVAAKLLRELLEVVIEGSQRSLRMRTQGRSLARGPTPYWIESATEFKVRIVEGSTKLLVEGPSLLEADPAQFEQREIFPELDVGLTAFDYFLESLEAATRGDATDLYDRQLLETFSEFGDVLGRGAEELQVGGNGAAIRITREQIHAFGELERSIPAPQYVRVVGYLDQIRHSDRTFKLQVGGRGTIKGIGEVDHAAKLRELWGQRVLVAGTAHYTAGGGVQRVEADTVKVASKRDEAIWEEIPEPLRRGETPRSLAVEQGPRSGLNAVVGRWPGDESEADILAALRELS